MTDEVERRLESFQKTLDEIKNKLGEVKVLKMTIENISEKLEKLSCDTKKNEENITEGDKSIALISQSLQQILDTQKEFKKSVEKMNETIVLIQNQPAKKWDHMTFAIISAVVGSIIGFIASSLFV